MTPTSVQWVPRNHIAAAAWLLLLTIAISLPLIANPGFFNHDELQKIDHVLQFGLRDYIEHYVVLRQGGEFGTPVRPVSFLIQGLVALFMPNYVFAIHLVDVVMHGVIAFVLYAVVVQLHGDRRFAWVTALLFAANPLVMFSVGWPAALMDRLYVLFGLLALWAAHRYVIQSESTFSLLGVALCSALAILSKETAMVLPVAIVILVLISPEQIRSRRLWIATLAWVIPVALFLLYRLPAILNSFGHRGSDGPYSPSFMHVLDGLQVYWAYPFLYQLTEMVNWVFLSQMELNLAALAHVVLLLLVFYAFGWRVAVAYVGAYFVSLAPVLMISIKGAHYMYGAAVVLSTALAALLMLRWRRPRYGLTIVPVVLAVTLLVHTWSSQRFIFETGECMSRALASAEGAYLASGRPTHMLIIPDEGARGHIVHRLATGRTQLGPYHPVHFSVVDALPAQSGASAYGLTANCVIYRRD